MSTNITLSFHFGQFRLVGAHEATDDCSLDGIVGLKPVSGDCWQPLETTSTYSLSAACPIGLI
jgi:hypothetical protein